MSETTEHGMLIERVKELRDRVREANDSPWMTGAYEHDVDTMNEAIAAVDWAIYKLRWRPVEEAPEDTTVIVYYRYDDSVSIGRLDTCLVGNTPPRWTIAGFMGRKPDMWMPLPEPPEAA